MSCINEMLNPEARSASCSALRKERSVKTKLKSVPRDSGLLGTTDEVDGGDLGCIDLSLLDRIIEGSKPIR